MADGTDDRLSQDWYRMRAAQERRLEAAATDEKAQQVHRRLAEMHEQALATGTYRLQIIDRG